MKYTHGFDISRYEPKVDWNLIRAQGFGFVIIKATEGTSYQDPVFPTHWANAKSAGLIRGAYHYLRAGDDANAQAQLFLRTVKLENGDLPAFLDLEETFNNNQPNANFISRAETWLKIVEQATGRKPLIYSRASFLTERVSINGRAPAWAKNYSVWIANYLFNYVEGSQPVEAPGWQPWVFWQYTNKGDAQGIYNDLGQKPSEIDLDWFRGSLQDLYQFVGAQQPTPPVPTKYVVKAGDTLSSIASQNGVTLDDLLAANPSLIQPGIELVVPASTPVTPTPVIPVTPPAPVTPPVTPSAPEPAPSDPIRYTIQPGDNLTRIAAKYGISVDALAAANNISNPNLIQVGQQLIIPKN